MPSQCKRPYQKFLDLQTNEEYERHFRHFERDDLLLIFKVTTYTQMLKNTSTTAYGKEEEVRDQVREMKYLLFSFMQPGLSVLKAIALGDFLMRLGGHPSDS